MKDTAEKLGVAIRTVRIHCAEDKNDGATKLVDMWAIPAGVEKPTDGSVTAGERKSWRKNKVRVT